MIRGIATAILTLAAVVLLAAACGGNGEQEDEAKELVTKAIALYDREGAAEASSMGRCISSSWI